PIGEQIFSNFQHLLFPTDARREERGLGLTNKAFSKLDAFVSFVRMLARCKYFFSFRNKKACFGRADFFSVIIPAGIIVSIISQNSRGATAAEQRRADMGVRAKTWGRRNRKSF